MGERGEHVNNINTSNVNNDGIFNHDESAKGTLQLEY